MINHNRTFIIVLTVLVIIFITTIMANTTALTSRYDLIKDLISTITAIIGVLAIWYQMKRDKDLTEAEFLMNLNNTFATNPEIKYIYTKLEANKNSSADPFSDDDMIKVVDYLTFFETISNLIQRNVLNFDMIDDLFAYRFFSIVHNVHIQKREIIKDADFYENLYRLHKEWVSYRLRKNLDIPYKDASLEIKDPNYASYFRKRVSQHAV